MSRDPEVCKQYDTDKLCHDTGTLEGLAGMLQRAEELEKGVVAIENEDGLRIWVGYVHFGAVFLYIIPLSHSQFMFHEQREVLAPDSCLIA